jgi:hypothetical protein
LRWLIDRVRHVLLVVAVMSMAACGSTLQRSGVQTNAGGSDVSSDGISAGTTGVTVGDGLTASGSTTAGTPADGISGSGAAAGVGGGGTATGGGGGGDGAAAPGAAANEPASDKPIRLGVVATDVGALAAIFGVSDEDYDYFRMDRAYVEHINKTGGINGRPIEMKTMMVDIAADADAEGQRACENFSRDNRVDVVFARLFNAESMIACLRQNGIAVFDPALHTHDRAAADHPNWIQPVAVGLDRLARAGIENAVEQGRLKPGDTLGVLHEDCAWARRIYNEVTKPLAESHGVKVVQATVKCIENLVNDLGPVTNQSRSAALRFQTESVTDVVFISFPEHFVWANFAKAAEEQQYRPSYHVTTNAFPYTISQPDNPIGAPEAQRRNAAGIGFIPQQDVGHEAQPADAAQDAMQGECRKADETMGGATELDPNEDPGGRAYWEMNFYIFCDVYFGLRGALQNSGGSTAPPDVGAGYTAYREGAVSPTFTGGRYGTSRLEGGGFVKPLEYNPQTQRFSYSSLPMRTLAE